MKSYILILVLLSSGPYTERFFTADECKEALMEAELVKGRELWSGVCSDKDDDIYAQIETEASWP